MQNNKLSCFSKMLEEWFRYFSFLLLSTTKFQQARWSWRCHVSPRLWRGCSWCDTQQSHLSVLRDQRCPASDTHLVQRWTATDLQWQSSDHARWDGQRKQKEREGTKQKRCSYSSFTVLSSGGRVLQIPRAQAEDTGRYTCVAVNEAGEDSIQYDVRVLCE